MSILLNVTNIEKTSCNFGILKERRSKFETLTSEAILIKRCNQILNNQLSKPGTLPIYYEILFKLIYFCTVYKC